MSEENVKRRLTAILAADVVGYSRLMEAKEEGTLNALKHHRSEFFDPTMNKYDGRIFKVMGDGFLVEFGSERWSRKFGPVVKVDRMKKVTIQNEETKEPFARV